MEKLHTPLEAILDQRISRRRVMNLCAGGIATMGAAGLPRLGFAQSQSPKYGGILTCVGTSDPSNFDVFASSSSSVINIVAACHNSLVMFDPLDPDKVIGDLAESWEVSADGKVYTFKIVGNAKFHDGVPLTSEDVKFTYDYTRNPPAGAVSVRQSLLGPIESIEAPDPRTVRINLKFPYPALLPTLATGYFVIVAKHTMAKEGNIRQVINGSGPYRYKDRVKGVSITVEKNPDYHVKGRPYLDGITFYFVPDQSTRYAYVRSGQVMYWDNCGGTFARRAQQEAPDTINVLSAQSYIGEAFTFNTTVKPLDDIRVRKALMMSIDRYEALKVISEGDGVIAGLQPKGMWGLPEAELESIPGYGRDVTANRAEAKRLLAEAGLESGFNLTLTTRKASTTHEARAVYLADQFAKVGAKVTIDVKETASYFDAMSKRSFQAATMSLESSANDPDHFFGDNHACGGARNYAGLCIPQADELFAQQSQMVDPAQRKKVVHEMEKLILEGYGTQVLYFRVKYILMSKKVQNFVMHPESDNHRRLQDIWLS